MNSYTREDGKLIRIASVIGLPAENAASYEALHSAVWPQVLERLALSHITNYSIYRHQELLFSYMEYTGTDLDADMAAVAEDPATQKWWELCKPLQQPLAERPGDAWWTPIREVFHVD